MSIDGINKFIDTSSIKQTLAQSGIDVYKLTIWTLVLTSLLILGPIVAIFVYGYDEEYGSLGTPSGCRRVGLKDMSNFTDQYSKKYAKGADATKAKPWTIKAMFLYPLKSGAPVEVDSGEIVRTGFKYDRQFALGQLVMGQPTLEGKIDSGWQFMSQRTFPRLALVKAEIWEPDPSTRGYNEDNEWVESQGCLVIRFPFSPDTDFSIEGLKNYAKIKLANLMGKAEPTVEFRIPFNPTKERAKSKRYTREMFSIWRDRLKALNMSNEIDHEVLEKLRYTLGTSNPIALFRIDPENYREVYKNAPKKKDVGFQTVVGMQDSYPVHILNMASVHDVAQKLSDKKASKHIWKNSYTLLNALRFRANIYFTGPPAFHEDDWTKAKIGEAEFHVSCRATRCKLPNVDPNTGIADSRNEPYAVLRGYRVIDPGSNSACLGMMTVPLSEGKVKVGDTIEVLTTGEHHFDGGSGPSVRGQGA